VSLSAGRESAEDSDQGGRETEAEQVTTGGILLKAIVFDFDGVIANSEPLHFAAFRDVLADEDVPLGERDYYDRYLGFDDFGVFRRVAIERGRAWNENDISALVARKFARMVALERDRSILFPGAADAIRRAAAAVPIAIASGALRPEILRVLEREHLTDAFTAIVAAGETPESKPAPDPYVRAVALLAASGAAPLSASECVAIEDSRWGLESARAAGLRTVAVTQTYDARELPAVDLVIPTLAALDISALHRLATT
jgi:HAD superfamily hydrolase (TIGR01509 family)